MCCCFFADFHQFIHGLLALVAQNCRFFLAFLQRCSFKQGENLRVEPYRVGGVALRTVELNASQGRGRLASSLVGGKPSDDVLGPTFG